jgi:alkylation response protein AidB-like acyl-CoA dehydrogenase
VEDEVLLSPTRWLAAHGVPVSQELVELERWWSTTGRAVSEAVDRMGTPWLQMFDRFGNREDRVVYPPEYRAMLLQGYRAGAVWHALAGEGLEATFRVGYVTSFFDPGVYCPYTVSLATALAVHKYAEAPVRERYLPPLLRRDDHVWQGATWMTEVGGGSDLGSTVQTRAVPTGQGWRLTGEKYFASNVGAEVALVAARLPEAPRTARGLNLFLVPRWRSDGGLNYFVRRLKDKVGTRSVPTGEVELADSEAHLLGRPEDGVYHVLEALNVSRVANAVGSVALAQRAVAEALQFGRRRVAFGRPVLDHPLLHAQLQAHLSRVRAAFFLAWHAVRLLEEVWGEHPPYSPRYHTFRLVTHLAKYWTAEVAFQAARWAVDVHGGAGVLAEHGVERLVREALILPIWEGTPHRQVLDGLEAMLHKGAHHALLDELAQLDASGSEALRRRVQAHLELPPDAREARAEGLFAELARFTADALSRR